MGMNVNEFNSTASQIQGLMGTLGTMTGNSSLSGITGSVFSIVNSAEQIKSDDPNAKANGIMNIVNQAMGLIEKLGNLQASAQNRVKNDKEKVEEVKKEAEATEAEITNSLDNIGDNIDAQSKVVEKATEEMTKAQEELNNAQAQIDETIKQIQEKQEKLKNTTKAEDQKRILEEIYNLGMSISDLTAIAVDYQEQFDEANQTVTDAYTQIETAKGNAVKVETEGNKAIVKSVADATEAGSDTAATQADGIKNITTGQTLQVSASVSGAIPVAGTIISTEASKKATDLITTGTTETTGSFTNLKELAAGIGKIGNNTKLIETFNTAIGGALESFDGLIGGWNSLVDPIITSLGTLSPEGDYATQAQALSETVLKDQDTIAKYQENNPTPETEQKTEISAPTSEQNDNTKKYELETPNFGI